MPTTPNFDELGDDALEAAAATLAERRRTAKRDRIAQLPDLDDDALRQEIATFESEAGEEHSWMQPHDDRDCVACTAEEILARRKRVRESQMPGADPLLYVPGAVGSRHFSCEAAEVCVGDVALMQVRPGVDAADYVQVVAVARAADRDRDGAPDPTVVSGDTAGAEGEGDVWVTWRRTNDPPAVPFTCRYHEGDYLDLSRATATAVTTAGPVERRPVDRIVLRRAEGSAEEISGGRGDVTVTRVDAEAWTQAAAVLSGWSVTAPADGSAHKVDFVIDFGQDATYTGRLDMSATDYDLPGHVRSSLEWLAANAEVEEVGEGRAADAARMLATCYVPA